MIDLAKIQYRVVVMDESKNQYNIKEYIENLGWEENDGELSVRTSFVAKNDKTSKGYLSKIIKPGCLVGVFATDGASQDEEVARGYVETWNPVEKRVSPAADGSFDWEFPPHSLTVFELNALK